MKIRITKAEVWQNSPRVYDADTDDEAYSTYTNVTEPRMFGEHLVETIQRMYQISPDSMEIFSAWDPKIDPRGVKLNELKAITEELQARGLNAVLGSEVEVAA